MVFAIWWRMNNDLYSLKLTKNDHAIRMRLLQCHYLVESIYFMQNSSQLRTLPHTIKSQWKQQGGEKKNLKPIELLLNCVKN